MHLLLDTQIMLWWLVDDPQLRADTMDLITTTACVVSVASIWEVAIKYRLGKLPVSAEQFREQSLRAGASILPILEGPLPALHNAPRPLSLGETASEPVGPVAQVLFQGDPLGAASGALE
jgi:PIN domain nuclease of toxin-antitoxin system